MTVEMPGAQGAQLGSNNVQINNFGPAVPPAPQATQIVAGNVPQAPPAFQPREDLMAALRAAAPGVSVVRAVTGLRGVGKTQVAAAYARECIDAGWRLVGWVNAEETAGVLTGLADVAAGLGIGEPGARLDAIGALVRNRLEADGERCLLVFDNVTDVGALRPFVPSAGKAQVVVTSTLAGAARLGKPLPVGVFSAEEALAFLADRARPDDQDGARELAAELGYLPLALAQAAAVIAAQWLTYQVYLERLRALPVQDYLLPADGEPYPRGVAEAILLSMNAVAEADGTGLCTVLISLLSLLYVSVCGRPSDHRYCSR